MGGHDVAACLVEDRGLNARVGGAERLPVAEGCIERAHVGIADKDGLEVYLWPLGIQLVLGHDSSAQRGDVMALQHISRMFNISFHRLTA